MFPNPQDALPLPAGQGADMFRRAAADLATAATAHDGRDARIRIWAGEWVARADAGPAAEGMDEQETARRISQIADYAGDRLAGGDGPEETARDVLARIHGFGDWPTMERHVTALEQGEGPAARFEQAAGAVVTGDIGALAALLASDPILVQARSDRVHRATLLHYTSANGVENHRQRTPPNIVEIARLLLDAGAEVDAEADVYGGGATPLGLVVTSAHPRQAGVQVDLAELLLAHGARLGPGTVRACLANGCPEVAAHLAATRDLALDLEEAAGIGRVDLIIADTTSPPEMSVKALMMAAWYGHAAAITALLDRGSEASSQAGDGGHTALHIAAYTGNPEVAALLIGRGAPLDLADDAYGTPPIVWALHGWLEERRPTPERYREVVTRLADAGAAIRPEWIATLRARGESELADRLASR